MNLKQIKKAVDAGKVVRWVNESYTIEKDDLNYIIVRGESFIGLTQKDGKTMNGKEEQFYIEYAADDSVEVPEPNETDMHNFSFVGSVVLPSRFDTNGIHLTTVEDGDGEKFEIETHRLIPA
jgi:hypothetical protein